MELKEPKKFEIHNTEKERIKDDIIKRLESVYDEIDKLQGVSSYHSTELMNLLNSIKEQIKAAEVMAHDTIK